MSPNEIITKETLLRLTKDQLLTVQSHYLNGVSLEIIEKLYFPWDKGLSSRSISILHKNNILTMEDYNKLKKKAEYDGVHFQYVLIKLEGCKALTAMFIRDRLG